YTLGFYYPGEDSDYRTRRAKFFRIQLEEFLLLAREEGVDPATLLGSYAGAMGRAQFMPDSYRYYAVDFNNDGKRDIWNNDIDAIGSVGNFLKKKGKWKDGLPITTRVDKVNGNHKAMVEKGIKPSLTIGDLRAAGIMVDNQYDDALATSLVELKNHSGMEYWAGMDNFYSITRYNNSRMYAMAVYQLAQAIAEKR
ncbi:MAG: lytic murein transglycosylase, partial [bacterium]